MDLLVEYSDSGKILPPDLNFEYIRKYKVFVEEGKLILDADYAYLGFTPEDPDEQKLVRRGRNYLYLDKVSALYYAYMNDEDCFMLLADNIGIFSIKKEVPNDEAEAIMLNILEQIDQKRN
jgi:hypothetical protein